MAKRWRKNYGAKHLVRIWLKFPAAMALLYKLNHSSEYWDQKTLTASKNNLYLLYYPHIELLILLHHGNC